MTMSVEAKHDFMLTTIDNPYDPFDEYDKWLVYDSANGYDTSGLVARLAHTSTEFGEIRQLKDTEKAVDAFLEVDPLGIYKKVVREIK